MSDEEEDSMSEGFSASEEDEWKPAKKDRRGRGGESDSDDDDSDFEDLPLLAGNSSNAKSAVATAAAAANRKREPKSRSASKQASAKKRKPTNQSLRAKLYNKYRPPPKTFATGSSGGAGTNSPSASTSRTAASKNARAPNESSEQRDDDEDSSSASSVEDYLVNPSDLNLGSSFFNVDGGLKATKASSPVPHFDCNAGVANLSDSGSEDNNESSAEEHAKTTAFDFRNLLEKANSLERAKVTIAKRTKEREAQQKNLSELENTTGTMDVKSLLELGENPNSSLDREDTAIIERGPQRLNKTKSTRVKRHTKTRPTSTAMAGPGSDSDDSDWEEVADDGTKAASDLNRSDSLEIHVDLPNRKHSKQDRKQMDLEMMLKRKLNREIKERQLLLHKTSLLCCFGRSYTYNRLLNDTTLMNLALKLLPSKNSYPPQSGTELKYFQSLVTWFKTAIKLSSPNLYPEKTASTRTYVKRELHEQIGRKEASCKQNMIFIFIILMRSMGLQCRLVVNMQPLALRPSQADLLKITLKRNEAKNESVEVKQDKSMVEEKLNKIKSSIQNDGEANKKAKCEEKKVELKKVDEKKVEVKKVNEKKEKTTQGESSLKSKSKTHDDVEKNKSKVDEKMEKSMHEEKIAKPKISKQNSLETKNKSTEESKTEKNRTAETHSKAESKVHVDIEKKAAKHDEKKDKSMQEEKLAKTKKSNENDVDVGKAKIKEKNVEEKKTEEKKVEEKPIPIEKSTRTKTQNTKIKLKDKESKKTKPQPVSNHIESEEFPEPTLTLNEIISTKEKPSNAKTKPPTLSKLKRPPATASANDEVAKKSKPSTSNSGDVTSLAQRRLRLTSTTTIVTTSDNKESPSTKRERPIIEVGSPILPKIVIQGSNEISSKVNEQVNGSEKPSSANVRVTRSRSRSKSPKMHINAAFLQTAAYKKKFPVELPVPSQTNKPKAKKSPNGKVKISSDFLKNTQASSSEPAAAPQRILRSRQKANEPTKLSIPQLDGAVDDADDASGSRPKKKSTTKRPQLKKLQKSHSKEDSDELFEPSPTKRQKLAPILPKAVQTLRKDRRVLSTDDDEAEAKSKRIPSAADMWIEVWSDVDDKWICVDLFKGKLDSVDAIRKSATNSFAYVFAFQNDLTVKDITARYCPHWTTTIRKSRVDKSWLDGAISPYYGRRTQRDIIEDVELRRIHEELPMPTTISDYKDHPLYALERHLLKFQAIYPAEPPTLGFVRGLPVYSRDCVHTLHSREIWLKSARTVKLGEQPYKIVKARPKWDRLTQTVIKDLPLEIFGYWQTEDYEPPTAENGLVPRNAYGNVELFKECMLPKKTVHLRLAGLNRVCKKLGIDCANAVNGFDFHQGACHPTYDGFVVCEEFEETVTAAWHQDQEEQERKEVDKYEARVYGNWKKLIRGLLIRERLKKKYNF